MEASLRVDPGLCVLASGRRPRPTAPPDTYRQCDVTDDTDVRALVEWARPDVVYHLAGLRGDVSEATLDAVNVVGFERLRRELRVHACGRIVRMLVVGSAAEIGHVPVDWLPVREDVPCRPTTAYGRSKRALVQAAVAEPADSGLEIVVARTFNLIGAGLDPRLAPAAFAVQVRAVARGETTVVRCGWLGGRRDYLDIADAVRAYRLLAEHGRPGEIVNVCSGRSVPMGDILAKLLTIAGVRAEIDTAAGPAPDDVADIRGSHDRLTRLTGWRPEVDIDTSLAAVYADRGG